MRGAFCCTVRPSFGLFIDAGGSVSEWTDSCHFEGIPDNGGNWHCYVRGGAFVDESAEYLACPVIGTLMELRTHSSVGFRCCRDLE